MEKTERGSEWRKWDLHFHTPASYDYKDKSITNEKIIEILEEKNISVVAITDHHLIDVDRIIELQKIGKEKNITILPGIEFRAELGGSESIHYIGIFSEKLKKQELNDIWIKLQSSCKITQTDIQSIGGDANIQCDFKETSKLIHELGGLVTVHAGSKANTFENITNSLPDKIAQKIGLVKGYIDVFELGKETDQTSYNEKVFPNLGFRLPMIICSDNHKITEYIVKQNLWIKADPTFEGLKQIIYEPEQRVKIQAEEPDFKEDKLVIDEVKFISQNNMFSSEPIRFNKNLNVIIGGKSSGKSILLYNIAKTLLTDRKVLKNENTPFNYRYEFDTGFDFEVKIISGISQSINRADDVPSILSEIKYIPQNYLSKLAEPENKKGNELLKLVRGLLLEDEEYNGKYQEFLNRVKSNDSNRESLINNYFEIQNRIVELRRDLISKGDEEVLNTSIKTNEERITKLKEVIGLNEAQIKEYDTYNGELEQIEIEKGKIKSDYSKINSFQTDAKNILNELNQKKERLLGSIENDAVKESFKKHFAIINQSLTFIESSIELIKVEDRNFVNDNIFKTQLSIKRERKQVLDKLLEPFVKNQEVKKQITDIEKLVIDDKQKLSVINQYKKDIKSNEDAFKHEKDKIFDAYIENFNEYKSIISELEERTKLLESDNLKIDGIPKFNFSKFRKRIIDISDGRKAHYNSYSIFNDDKSGTSDFELDNFIDELKKVFSSMAETKDYSFNSKTDVKNAIKVLLNDYFFDYWEVNYDNDTLTKMSTGKASFVILMLIVGLSKSKAPILIDQPEDNLDNRSITKDLVEYLRNKKFERQIILVTHNPNVVVNADAENIIVANQKGQNDKITTSPYQFDYINGSIENTKSFDKLETDLLKSMGIREHIADIVEGGKEAFRKREKKYGF